MASDTPPSDSQSRNVKPESGSGRPAANPYAAMNQSRRSFSIQSGTFASPRPSARCMDTTSTQRPNFTPTARSVPTM